MLIRFSFIVMMSSLSFVCLAGDDTDCHREESTYDINQCTLHDLAEAKADMRQYYAKSMQRYANSKTLSNEIKQAQLSWEQYSQQYCSSMYHLWEGGSIAEVVAKNCQIEMMRERTHQLWESYLTNLDDTPAVLPEPKYE